MDEVDFTILAANSVLTDLIDKCPPAEACRDAFDRTAKATVKMANNNGGFGSPNYTLGPGKRPKRARTGHDENHMDWSPRSESASVPTKQRRHLPRASSDLNQIGEFHSNGSLAEVMNSVVATPAPGDMPRLQSTTFRRSAMNTIKPEPDGFSLMTNVPPAPLSTGSTSDIAMTPPSLGNMRPSPTMPNSAVSIASPTSSLTPTASNHFSTPMQTTPGPGSTTNSVESSMAGFGYVNQNNPVTSMPPPGPINFADLQGMEFLQSLQGAPTDNEAEMDLGFGLGWEGIHHNFNDGQQVDLFEGFFFGGQQGGAGGGTSAGGGSGLGP